MQQPGRRRKALRIVPQGGAAGFVSIPLFNSMKG